jgi:hypothetical protein
LGSTSKPTGRTVDGQVEMITASGQTWLWNGKTNQVAVLNKTNRQQYVTVRQGDPEIRVTAVVDGKKYYVASSDYAAALANKKAKEPLPKPPVQPGSVCSGWGCPKPQPPRTSTTIQVFDVKPKAPVPTINLGGFSNGVAGQNAVSPKPVAPVAPSPAFVQTTANPLSAYRGVPPAQQYKFENKRF